MKKVLCLYRVSTKHQVDKKDDIPMQRRECLAFIDRMEDWVFFDERMEKGVSGYKVSAYKRDAIVEIRTLAEQRKFDVLLVFMFDRLGRREDETPFLVEWFVEHGIEVWSTQEGQQRIESRADKLINYVRYWQAGGESEKTSMRVKASHTQMTTDGIWRGGVAPFGYKLVHNGRIGKKNRQLYDLEQDEFEAGIVKEIFQLICYEGYGTLRVANLLNDKYKGMTKVWTPQTIRNMIRNVIYTGRMHMNDVVSEPIEALRIVSDDDMQFAKYAISSRIPRKYTAQRQSENESVPESVTKTSVYGATLLSGLLYCAHCGCRLVGSYCTRQLATHAYHRPIYRCYNGSVRAKHCTGQSVYSARRIEDAVLEVVRQYFLSISHTMDSVWKEQVRLQLRDNNSRKLKSAETSLASLRTQQASLRQEVLKAIQGESVFETEMLKEMLDENKKAISEAEQAVAQCAEDRKSEAEKLRHLSEQYSNITDWAREFDVVDDNAKKMILARIIDKITIDRDYNIHIVFFVTNEAFLTIYKDSSHSAHTECMVHVAASGE